MAQKIKTGNIVSFVLGLLLGFLLGVTIGTLFVAAISTNDPYATLRGQTGSSTLKIPNTPFPILHSPTPIAPPGFKLKGDILIKDDTPIQYWVCVPKLEVKNNPGDEFPAIDYLYYGASVTVYERSRGVLGWAMIDRAIWVSSLGLCPW